MPDVNERDLMVIGAGPGGYGAAFHAADKGAQVTLIDGSDRPGGTCLHVGCIPSKALLHAAKLITDAREADILGVHFEPPRIDINGVRTQWQKVVNGLAQGLAGLCRRRNVEFLRGQRAAFVDSQTLQLADGSRY